MGHKRAEIPEEGFSLPAESHIVFYIALEDGIELVRVIHGSQDLEKAWAVDESDKDRN